MTAELRALRIAALDPGRLAGFWGALLGGRPGADATSLVPVDGTGFGLRFRRTARAKTVQNHRHLDLTSTSLAGQTRTVARALELGGRHVDVGQSPTDRHVVLADPEGNEFCVIEPGNAFLADCGLVGALACDGTRQVGLFWSRALGWPLVWDQGEETAIRSPRGGPKLTWGGPPLMPVVGEERLHFELVPPDGEQAAERDRLVALGARLVGPGPDGDGALLMADPDGREFLLLAAR